MGGKIDFMADLSDDKYPLSVINAKLYWDVETGDPVSEVEIRTESAGTYAGSLAVPFQKDIPDGIATVVFTSVNTHLGKTYDTVYVAVNRPKFESLSLVSGSWKKNLVPVEGKEHEYAYEGTLPTDFQPYIVTPTIDGKGSEITFGWDGSQIAINGGKAIPFDVAGKGKITFNTKTFVGTPFIDIRIKDVKADPTPQGSYKALVPLKKGDKLSFSGIEDIDSWYFEPDHFNVKEDGVYQFTGIAVEETDGQTIGGRWRYDYISMKFFGQAGWGAEYGTVTLTAEAQKYLGAAGNIELASGVQLEKGATYVMTVTNCTALNSDNKFDCIVDFKKL